MGVAETAQLAVNLTLGGNFSSGMAQAESSLGRFNTSARAGGSHAGALSGAFGKVGMAASAAGGALSHAGSQLKGLVTGPLGMLGMAGGVAGLGLALKGTVTSAMDFQSAMELISTQAGGTQQEVDSMSKAILSMAGSVGTGPAALAAGLYHVESAGIRGAKALDVLRVAAEGAKVGNADLESVTNALIAATNSGVAGVSDMAGAMGSLNAIVGAGNMRMQDLTDAFSTGILSTAKTFGISIQSVGAAIADMTNQGVPAIDAATRLRMTISLLGAPSSKAAKEFKNIGLGQLDLATAMRGPGGISAAVQMLAQHMQKAGLIDASGNVSTKGADMLSQAFGGGRSSSAIMTLVGSMGKLSDIQKQVNAGATGFGDAWAKTQEDAQFKLEKFQAVLGAVAVKVGGALLPTITDALGGLSTWLDSHQQDVVDAFTGIAAGARQAFGIVSGIAKGVMDAWGSIPPELRDLIVKGVVADRTMKFLFGFSPIGSIVSGLEGALAKAVGTGMASAGLGKLFVQPVFVTNMGAGGMGGNLAGDAAGAAGKGGLLSGLFGAGADSAATVGAGGLMLAAGTVTAIGAAVTGAMFYGIPALVNAIWPNGNKPGEGSVTNPMTGKAVTTGSVLGIPDSVGAQSHAYGAIGNMLATKAAQSIAFVGPQQSMLTAGRDTHENLLPTNQLLADLKANGINLAAIANKALVALDPLHRDFMAQLGILEKTADPAQMAKAASKAAADVLKGVGSAAGTKSLLETLEKDRNAVAATGDKKLLAQIDGAIRDVKSKIAPREWVQSQLAEARKVAASSESQKQKMADLKAIQQRLLSHSDTAAAKQVGLLGKIASNPVSVTVNVDTSVSTRDIALRTRVGKTYGNGTKRVGNAF